MAFLYLGIYYLLEYLIIIFPIVTCQRCGHKTPNIKFHAPPKIFKLLAGKMAKQGRSKLISLMMFLNVRAQVKIQGCRARHKSTLLFLRGSTVGGEQAHHNYEINIKRSAACGSCRTRSARLEGNARAPRVQMKIERFRARRRARRGAKKNQFRAESREKFASISPSHRRLAN